MSCGRPGSLWPMVWPKLRRSIPTRKSRHERREAPAWDRSLSKHIPFPGFYVPGRGVIHPAGAWGHPSSFPLRGRWERPAPFNEQAPSPSLTVWFGSSSGCARIPICTNHANSLRIIWEQFPFPVCHFRDLIQRLYETCEEARSDSDLRMSERNRDLSPCLRFRRSRRVNSCLFRSLIAK
jgi:hypothetical protein